MSYASISDSTGEGCYQLLDEKSSRLQDKTQFLPKKFNRNEGNCQGERDSAITAKCLTGLKIYAKLCKPNGLASESTPMGGSTN